MSKEELAKIIPVNPPNVNKNTNPKAQYNEGENLRREP